MAENTDQLVENITRAEIQAERMASIEALSGGRVLVPQPNMHKVIEYDGDGKSVWEAAVQFPFSANRLPNGNTLVASPNSGKVVELNRGGRVVWEQVRAVPSSWTTPIVIRAGGRDQVITAADSWIIAYDPADGKELWRVKTDHGDAAPSPVAAADRVFAMIDDSAPLTFGPRSVPAPTTVLR